MKTLYLIRHAKSSWKFPFLGDHARPLNKRGKRDAPEMGRRLKEKGIYPDLMLCSTAKRTKKTAQKIADTLHYPQKEIVYTEDLYLADETQILDIIKKQNDRYNTLFVYLHNPGITELASFLSATYIANVPTCGIVALAFKADHWKEIDLKNSELLFFDFPKKVA